MTIAVKHNHLEIVKYLIQNGADVNQVNEVRFAPKIPFDTKLNTCALQFESTVLVTAILHNHAEIITILLDHGAHTTNLDWVSNFFAARSVWFD